MKNYLKKLVILAPPRATTLAILQFLGARAPKKLCARQALILSIIRCKYHELTQNSLGESLMEKSMSGTPPHSHLNFSFP